MGLKRDFSVEFPEVVSELPQLLEKLGIVDQGSIYPDRLLPYSVNLVLNTHSPIVVCPYYNKSVVIVQGESCRGTKDVVWFFERPKNGDRALRLIFQLKLSSALCPKDTKIDSVLLKKVIADFVEKALKGFCFG